ncbi:hypothetical protein [Pedobacter antarcticus]|uniref:hypothetical protein n=1 Tax=Pedobacter antarcticus TaxID=34086 RepID=UPI002931E48C|nr:hypothetical protein [Pedobacter antarcticus]
MKKIFLTFAIALMGFTATYAQQSKKQQLTSEQRAEKSTAKLEKELSLTADQKQKVYAIELNKFKQNQDWHQKAKAERDQKKDMAMKGMKENREQLNKVLTAEQQSKLETIHKEKKGSRHGMKGKRGLRADSTATKA